MTVPPINPSISEESDDMDSLPPEEDIYRRKYQLLLERCEVLQQDNERIVHRIYQVKKMTKRCKKEIKFLMNRLDMHGDSFRTIKAEEEDVKPNISTLPQFPGFIVPKTEKGSTPSSNRSTADKNASGKKTATKRKATKTEKAEKDPNAPKKPCNAFFQFCQEQRPIILAEGCSDSSGAEPSKQEVTRQLASRWRALSSEDKKVYVAMFERSKEKYAEEMSAYIKKE